MPTFHLSFDLNSPEDVNELCNNLRKIAESIKPAAPKKEPEKEGFISGEELMRRIGKAAQTIATWRGEGMPYIVGKPCKYPWNETYAWIKANKMLGEKMK